MPGYGDSESLVPLTFAGIADRLVAMLDHLHIDQADLVGLSFGGMHAMHTALSHPDRVRRLVLADTSPAFGMDGTDADEWVRSRLEPLDSGTTLADAASSIVDAITATTLDAVIYTEVVGAFAEIPTDGFRAAVHCLPSNDIRGRLHTIHHPTLVIVGELDEETPVSYSRMIADTLVNSDMHILPGVGHLSPSEAPDAFNSLVSNFLSGPIGAS